MVCVNCKLDRIPEEQHIEQKGKKWRIYTCRVCKYKDIEEFVPKRIWSDIQHRFEYDIWDETDTDVNYDHPGD